MTLGFLSKKQVNEKPQEHPFSNWCNVTTCHGIYDWYTSKYWVSFILWFVLIAICFVVCLFQILTLILDFVETKPFYHSTVYMNDFETAPWPNVTICNINRISNETAKNDVKIDTKAIIWLLGSPMVDYDFKLLTSDVPEYEAAWENYLNNSLENLRTPDELFRQMGHWCYYMFQKCTFGSIKFECCDYAKEVLNREYGLCWSITPPLNITGKYQEHLKQEIPGSAHGMKMIVQPSLQYYLGNEVILNNYLERGIIVSIDYNPYRMTFSDPVTVTPGKQARISLKPTLSTYTVPPLHMRIFPLECKLNGMFEILKGPYERENCYYECRQKQTRNNCGCILMSEHKTNYSVCNMTRLFNCYQTTDIGELELNTPEFKLCSDKCLPKCEDDFQVQVTPTISDFPDPKFIRPIADMYAKTLFGDRNLTDNLKANLDKYAAYYAKIMEDDIYLNIYFPTRGYQVINHKEKSSIPELLAKIGGQTSLWLGASIITLCQAVYYLGYGIVKRMYVESKNKAKCEVGKDATNKGTEFEERKFSNISSIDALNYSESTEMKNPSATSMHRQTAWSSMNGRRYGKVYEVAKNLKKGRNKLKDTILPPAVYY